MGNQQDFPWPCLKVNESALPQGGSSVTSSFEKGPPKVGVTFILSGDTARLPLLPRKAEVVFWFLFWSDQLGKGKQRDQGVNHRPPEGLIVMWQVNAWMQV